MYRLMIAKLEPPIIPFMPLLIKGQQAFVVIAVQHVCTQTLLPLSFLPDMTFTHEGNKTFIENLVNFEKMVRFLADYF